MDALRGLNTLMASNGIIDNATYDAYQIAVVGPLEKNGLNMRGFVYDIPQTNFTYSMLEAQEKVSAMATYVSISSDPIPVGSQMSLRRLTGSIPRQKHTIRITEEDLRNKYDELKNIEGSASFVNTNETIAIRSLVENTLFEQHADIVERHKNSLNYAVGQVKSLAQLTVNNENNPRGIKDVTFKMHVPEDNFRIDKKWFTENADGTYTPIAEATPIKDLEDFVYWLKMNRYGNVEFEWDATFTHALVRHPNVLPTLGYVLNPGLRMAYNDDKQATAVAAGAKDAALVEALREYLEIDGIYVSETFTEVDRYDAESDEFVSKRLRVFEPGIVAVHPTGNIGKIKNVAPMRGDNSAISTLIFDGHGIVEYFYDAKARMQEWRSELTILPVLTRPRDMYYFNVVEKATGASVKKSAKKSE